MTNWRQVVSTKRMRIGMYALCHKEAAGRTVPYKPRESVSQFGCDSGYIPYFLKRTLKSDDGEPLDWHIGIEPALVDDGKSDTAFVIDLKPNDKAGNVSLYEVVDVWD